MCITSAFLRMGGYCYLVNGNGMRRIEKDDHNKASESSNINNNNNKYKIL